MDKKGWIKIWRKIVNSEIWEQEPWRLKTWIYLITEANHSKEEKHGRKLKRGQVYINRIEDLCKEVRWKKGFVYQKPTVNAMKHFWKWLRKKDMVDTKKTTRGTIITILNYDKYQNIERTSVDTKTSSTVDTTQTPTVFHDRQECKELKNISISKDIERNKRKNLDIIFLYASKKNISLEDKNIKQSFIRRNLRPAQNLVPYKLARLEQVMNFLETHPECRGHQKWTLETVGKFVDEDLTRLEEMGKKNRKPYFQGNPMIWSELKKKWFVIVDSEWLEFAGQESEIEWK
jgi:hypothetical protein